MSNKITIPNRKKMPPLGSISKLNLAEPEIIHLGNSMEANIIRAGKEEITRIDIVFEAGSAFQDKRLVAGSANNLLKEGTRNKSSVDIANILDYHGAYLNTQINKDTASVTLYALTKHLDKLLPLLGEIISDATFPEQELNIYLQRQKQKFLVNFEKVGYRASLEFNKMIFGEHTAYGQVLSKDDFDKISRQDVLNFYHSRYRPDNAYIIISGNVNDNVLFLTEQHLGSLTSNAIETEQNSIVYSTEPKIDNLFIERPEALQSALRIGKQIINKTDPDFPGLQLLNTVLGGYFGSRLMSNLREDKGFTYGIGSYIQTYKHSAYFAISTEVNADYTEAAISEICKEIDLLRTVPVGKEELQLVKNYLFGNFLKSFDGPLALAERLRAVRDIGLDFSYYTKNFEAMKNITGEQLMNLANQYIESKTLLHLAVGRKQ